METAPTAINGAAMPLKEQQSLDALTRHVDDEKQNRTRVLSTLPEDAEVGDEVIVHNRIYKYTGDAWLQIMTMNEE